MNNTENELIVSLLSVCETTFAEPTTGPLFNVADRYGFNPVVLCVLAETAGLLYWPAGDGGPALTSAGVSAVEAYRANNPDGPAPLYPPEA